MKKMIVLFFSAAVLAFLLNACATPAAETAPIRQEYGRMN